MRFSCGVTAASWVIRVSGRLSTPGVPRACGHFAIRRKRKPKLCPLLPCLGFLSFSRSFHIGLLCQGWRQRLLQQARALCKKEPVQPCATISWLFFWLYFPKWLAV